MSETINLIIGILLGVLGAAINNFGIVLQKRQVNIKIDIENIEENSLKLTNFLKDPLWILGILGQTILYLPFLIFAMDLIGVTLLQPISNSGITFLVAGLILLIGERIKRSEIFGIIILIFGVITVALGNVIGDITLGSFLSYNSIISFWIFFFIIIILSIISIVFILTNKKTQLAFLGFLSGLFYALVSISLQIFILALFELSSPLSILILILGIMGALIGTILGIYTTQEAFKKGQAINIIPFSQISMNIIPILAGIFVFGQVILAPIFFWIGVISIIIAASLLARFQK
ncbi:MAG: hypothetical protein GF329_02620 [Candidatus Lokiarchaeota archaeon]|nr:hypothetical protein [Candidatus Lokiarchaeota archaeon]